MIYKGTLNKRGGGQGESGDLMVFLFDHALLMVKPKTKVEQYKVYRRVRTYHSIWLSLPTSFCCLAHPIRIAPRLRPRRVCWKSGEQTTTTPEEPSRPTATKGLQGWFLDHNGSPWTKILPNNVVGEHVC